MANQYVNIKSTSIWFNMCIQYVYFTRVQIHAIPIQSPTPSHRFLLLESMSLFKLHLASCINWDQPIWCPVGRLWLIILCVCTCYWLFQELDSMPAYQGFDLMKVLAPRACKQQRPGVAHGMVDGLLWPRSSLHGGKEQKHLIVCDFSASGFQPRMSETD